MDYIAEVHVILQGAFEGHFDGLRDRHGCFASRQRQSDGARIGPESNALGHARV